MEGIRGKEPVKYFYKLYDEYDSIKKISFMARTTDIQQLLQLEFLLEVYLNKKEYARGIGEQR